MNTADNVTIVEVGPRDGLQNEERILDPTHRAAFVRRLMEAGLRRIEVASFVDPRRVPQMGGAEDVLAQLGEHPADVSFIGLVLNAQGGQRAAAAEHLDEVNVVVPVSDRFGRANQGMSTDEALVGAEIVRDLALEAGKSFSITLAVAFGCPYEGEISLGRVVDTASRAASLSPAELAIADTIGCAVPSQVSRTINAVADHTDVPLRVHFHETRHTGLANVQAALDNGVRVIDSSAAGLGGCPFAPGAAGNIATEDLAWMLDRSGFITGVDPTGVAAAGRQTCALLGVPARSGVGSAGIFPRLDTSPR